MNPERWQKIEEVFQAALDLSGAEREEFIRRECGNDADLLVEVKKLIDRYETEETFLESPVWTDSLLLQPSLKQQIAVSLENEIQPDKEIQNFVGRQIGAFRLTTEIGRGGMGVVYAAERADGEFRQKVAVKLIKRGMDTDFIVKRFRHERQIAAALNHPNIARLLDGGTTSDDLPYFVLEFIEGKPFFKYAEAKNLDLRQKLKLFLRVCAAIAYAHNKQIIHRDIKPGNILVTEDGEPKLLDFGIAKILDPDLIHESVMPTATQMRLMTPEYASPEQVKGDEITTASDQYSLGVLLYELLTGARPYKFPSRAPHEIARIICEEIPSEPSSGEFGKMPTGDFVFDKDFCQKLDRIVLKALRKNPAERYASVKEFAADIERVLRGEEVRAESFTGDRKAVTGNQKSLLPLQTADDKSIAVLPFKTLKIISIDETGDDAFLGVGLADALITRLSTVKRLAVRPTSSVLRYNSDAADSFKAGAELNVKFILDGNIVKINKRLRVSVQLLNVVKNSVVWAERFDEDFVDVLSLEDSISARVAESLLPQLTVGEIENLAKRGTEIPEAYQAYLRGRFHWNTFTEEGFAKAFVAYHEAIAHDPKYALAFAGIADYYIWLGIYGVLSPKDSYIPAQEAARRAVEIDSLLAEAHAALGFAELCGNYDWEQGEKNIRHAIELSPNYAVAHNWLAICLLTAGRFEEAIKHAKRAIELDPLTYQNHRTLAWGYYFSRRFDEALVQVDRTIEKFPTLGTAYFNRAWLLRSMGKAEEGLRSSEKAVETSNGSGFILLGHAQALAAAGKLNEAEAVIEQVKSQATRYVSYYHIALAYCHARETEKTFDALEQAWKDREGWLAWLGVEPAFDPVRDDSRFAELMKQIGIPPIEKTADVDTAAQNIITAPEAETMLYKKTSKRRLSAPLKYSLATLAFLIAAFVLYQIAAHTTIDLSSTPPEERWKNVFASTMKVQRLTTSGKERLAAISPDGKQIAFVSEKEETESLWIRQTDSENANQIAAPEGVLFVGLKFSPDGKFVYYTTLSRDYTKRTLWRILINAPDKTPQKVLDNVNSAIGIAPDGNRIAYFNFDANTKLMNLFVADLNEDATLKSLKTIATRLQPDYFLGNPAFSPDGNLIAYPTAVVADQKEKVNLFTVNLETGAEEKLVERDFNDIVAVEWRKYGEEIVISANEKNTDPLQLWVISYPSREISRLTNDLNNYYGVSLAKNADALVTVKRETISNTAIVEFGGGKTFVRLIFEGVNRQDGIEGVNWTSDNRILYISSVGGKNSITLANADGSNSRIINLGDAMPSNPLLTADGRYLFFIDQKEQQSKLIRYEMATGAIAEVTSHFTLTPTLTPDEKFIIYSTFNAERKTTLHRVPVEGGAETELTSVRAFGAVVSPDNKFIACYYTTDKGEGWKIGIFPIEGGSPVQTLDPPNTVNLQSLLNRPLAWSLDNRLIYYINDKGGVSNIFRVTADGKNKTEQVTDFPTGNIFDFSLSPDRKRAVISRGSISSDIVIFQNSK